jgi:predicted lipid-binding transport protein (Tim44 family)
MKRTIHVKRIAATLATALTALLVAAPAALARGGGGSAGFGGGGRGFGGFGGGGGGAFGRGHFFFLPIGGGGGVILGLIVLFILIRVVLPLVVKWWQGQQASGTAARRRVAERERRVELAAAEASEDDPSFAPDFVRAQASTLFTDIQMAWTAGDRVRLRGIVAPTLLQEWERRLDDFDRKGWHNHVELVQPPKVEYIGLKHTGQGDDRVVVRIQATLRDYVVDNYGNRIGRVDSLGDTTHVREFWTLCKRDDHWILQSIEQGAEGEHALKEEIVASPWSNEGAMRDEALVEGAVAEAVPEGTNLAEVASLDYGTDARAAANDLSLADGRFAPDVLEVAARRAVAAWVEAIDGEDAKLLAIARPDAAREMLHPGDPSARTRLVVRGLEVKHIQIAALDAATEPPTMTIDVELVGRRYLEDRDTAAVVAGSQSRATTFTERWTLALDGPAEQPWRIAGVGSPLSTA